MKQHLLSAFAIVALLFAACGGGDDAPTTIPVSGIKLDKSSLSLEIGEKATLTATIAPSDATNKSITWSSANSSIATVNNGVVEGVATGETTITAKTNDGGFTATITVKVTLPAVKVSKIKIGPENATIELGETTQFAAAISPSDAENREVEWSSSDPSVATIKVTNTNYIAEVTGVGKGTATITATAKDGSGVKASTTITVVGAMPTALTINGAKNPDAIYTWHGKEVVLTLACTPANADISRLYWIWKHAQASSYPNALNYNLQANSAQVSLSHSVNNCADELVTVTAYDSESTRNEMAMAYIHFRTLGWLYDGKYATAPFTGQGYNYNWNKTYHENGLNFSAYYNTNGLAEITPPTTEAHGGYANFYIPTSEYTLTSSDESKIKVTKNDDGKSWHLERLNTTDLVAVTLTYKCGEHTQTYTLNLIP